MIFLNKRVSHINRKDIYFLAAVCLKEKLIAERAIASYTFDGVFHR